MNKTAKRIRLDRFGKPISRYFTVQGFPRLSLYRQMKEKVAK